MSHFGKLYLSNKMTGIPFLNAPWFDLVTAQLLELHGVTEVFSPAQHDRDMGLDPMKCFTGSQTEMHANGGLQLRDVLGADLAWIAKKADGMVVGPAWPHSRGAIAEIALAQALAIPVWETKVFFEYHSKGRPDLLELGQHRLPQLKELLGVSELV